MLDPLSSVRTLLLDKRRRAIEDGGLFAHTTNYFARQTLESWYNNLETHLTNYLSMTKTKTKTKPKLTNGPLTDRVTLHGPKTDQFN